MITVGKTYRSQWASLQQELNLVKIQIHSLEHTCGFSTDLKGWTYDKGCYFCPPPPVQQIKLQKVIKGSVFPTDISLSQQFWNKDK